MPRKAEDLTERTVKDARYDGSKKVQKLTDGRTPGLHLVLKANGRKTWRLKYTHAGKPKSLTLGNYPAMKLTDARGAAEDARKLLRRGTDPSRERQDQEADRREEAARIAGLDTFAAIVMEWVEQVHYHNVVSAHSERNRRRFELHLFPVLGGERIADITPAKLLSALRKIEDTGRIETARRLHTLAGQVFRYAVVTGRAERDVSADLRDHLRSAVVQHHAAITDPVKLAQLLRAIDGHAGQPATKAALQLAALLFMRPGELRTLTWDLISLPGGELDYQPSKGGAPIVTPLPHQAVVILTELHRLTGPDGYVFPSMRGKGRPLSDNTLNAALRSLGYEGMMTAHGFRAVARTVLVERLDFPVEWVEMQLGHAVKDALGRAYNRTTYLEQRQRMLQEWADYLDVLRSSVVALPTKAVG
jgi:integrase